VLKKEHLILPLWCISKKHNQGFVWRSRATWSDKEFEGFDKDKLCKPWGFYYRGTTKDLCCVSLHELEVQCIQRWDVCCCKMYKFSFTTATPPLHSVKNSQDVVKIIIYVFFPPLSLSTCNILFHSEKDNNWTETLYYWNTRFILIELEGLCFLWLCWH